MSDTPRTDVAQHNMGSIVEPHYVVDIDFARELERELGEAVAKERERCAKVCERVSIPYENTSSEAAAAIRKGE
jgi:hypothetical protein